MFKKCLLFILLLSFALRYSASGQSCCVKPTGEWQTLAMSTSFKESHLAPKPFAYNVAKGSMITFNTQDGKAGNAYYLPSDEATNKVLIIFHEWWGLNDYIKKEADNWQKMLGNVDVYAIDLYDGQVASDPDVASKLASGLDPKRATTIIKGALSKIGPDKQVASLGWCMGGTWAFTASVLAANQATGCVIYYGFPEKENKNIRDLKTDVLYILGSQDQFIKKPFVDEFGGKVKATGHTFELHEYDAPHAFANPSNPKYNSLAATQAQGEALKFLKAKLVLE